nr:hypothetical protein BN993_05762 [Virgibacillus halodenitrificans]
MGRELKGKSLVEDGVHDAVYTRTERARGALLPILEGGVHLASPFRIAGPSQGRDRSLDPVLQRRAATSVSGLCGTPSTPSINGVGCAETRGALQWGRLESILQKVMDDVLEKLETLVSLTISSCFKMKVPLYI